MKITIEINKRDAAELKKGWGRGDGDRRGEFTRDNFGEINRFAGYLVAQELHRLDEVKERGLS